MDLGVSFHRLAGERRLDVRAHRLEARGAQNLCDWMPDDLVAWHAEPFGVALADPEVAHRRASLRDRDRQERQGGLRTPERLLDGLGIATHLPHNNVGPEFSASMAPA